MYFIDIIKTRRSIRRFRSEKLPESDLIELVETARCAPAGANIQSLEYIIINDPQVCDSIFPHVAWASHVKPARNPAKSQRPVAYIAVIFDNEIKCSGATVDAAAAIENILLAAWTKRIGSCWLGLIDRKALAKLFNLPERYIVDSLVALGYPAERPVMENCKTDSTKYYLDSDDVLHVPKRPLRQIAHANKFGGIV